MRFRDLFQSFSAFVCLQGQQIYFKQNCFWEWERVISLPHPSGAVATLGEWPYQEAIGVTIEWYQCFLIGTLLIHVFHYMYQDLPIITSLVLKSFDRVISMSFWEFSKSNVGLQDIFFFKFCPTHTHTHTKMADNLYKYHNILWECCQTFGLTWRGILSIIIFFKTADFFPHVWWDLKNSAFKLCFKVLRVISVGFFPWFVY